MASGDYKIERVEENDPWRCQATIKTQGQCRNKATTQGGTCPVHGGNGAINRQEKENIRNYHLVKWQAKLNEKANSSELKSLRDEIGVLRILLEERFNSCNDAHDLLLQSHQISDLVVKIEKVVSSCHRLEGSMGQLLDKQAILQFASGVIDILTEYVEDESILNNMASRIMALVSKNDTSTDAALS